jgi:Cu-Zn family superoxide dismutase
MLRIALILIALVAIAGPAVAAKKPKTYAIPGDDVYPEGVTTAGKSLYVGSTTDGTIYRGAIKGGALSEFLPGGADGRTTAVGLKTRDGRLYVAGGPTGKVFVYDLSSKALVAGYDTGSGGFLNDIAIERDGDVIVTDSLRGFLLRIAPGGETEQLPYDTGRQGGFNANGIVPLSAHEVLFVDSGDGTLTLFDTDTGVGTLVPVRGGALTNGDGLVRKGRALFVVRNEQELIAKVRLDGRLRSARVRRQVTHPTFAFPTTAALAQGRLIVVNSQFDVRNSGGTPEPFTLTSIKKP